MFHQGFATAKLLLSVTFNAIGLVALLAAAWLMPQFLELIVRSGTG